MYPDLLPGCHADIWFPANTFRRIRWYSRASGTPKSPKMGVYISQFFFILHVKALNSLKYYSSENKIIYKGISPSYKGIKPTHTLFLYSKIKTLFTYLNKKRDKSNNFISRRHEEHM